MEKQKTLDLNNFKLEELSTDEMLEVDGGVVPFLVAASYIGAGSGIIGAGYVGGKWIAKKVFK